MHISELKNEVASLTVDNQYLQYQISAYLSVITILQKSMTFSQEKNLKAFYQYVRDQYLNNFDLDEDQEEKLEVFLDVLEGILHQTPNQLR